VIKSTLIDRISIQAPHLYRQDAQKIVNTIFQEITAAMARGDRVARNQRIRKARFTNANSRWREGLLRD